MARRVEKEDEDDYDAEEDLRDWMDASSDDQTARRNKEERGTKEARTSPGNRASHRN